MNKNIQETFLSNYSRVTSPSHESRWQKIIAHQESLGLQKEIQHLKQKAQERDLSEWEANRLEEVQLILAQTTNGDNLTQ